jgi:Family of unknown function (DUF6069)
MTATLTDTAAGTTTRRTLAVPGIAAAVAAAVAVTAYAAVAEAAGISFAADGEQIPLLGFAQLTFGFSIIGVILAAVLRRKAAQPRRTFVRTTVVLAAISLAAPFLLPLDAASIAGLVVAHVIAAAIVIPAVASRLR